MEEVEKAISGFEEAGIHLRPVLEERLAGCVVPLDTAVSMALHLLLMKQSRLTEMFITTRNCVILPLLKEIIRLRAELEKVRQGEI